MALRRIESVKWEDISTAWNLEGSEWFPSKVWENINTVWNVQDSKWGADDAFENVIFFRVLEKLHKLLANEFYVPIYFDEHRGNQSFLIKPLEDNLEQIFNSGQEREYMVMIEHKLLSGGSFNRNHIKQAAETYERVKKLIFNNISHENNWYNGRIESIITTRDEEALLSEMQFNCTSREVSPN